MTPEQIAIEAYIKRYSLDTFHPCAALIDMDGTLYDSMGHHAAAWHRMVSELGIPCTRDEFFLYEGRTGASTINLIFQRAYGRPATDDEVSRLYHRKTVYFSELPMVGAMPYADVMVEKLMAHGVATVLVTGSGQNTLLNRLETDFPGAFSPTLRVTGHDVTHGKPHPEPYLKGMTLAGVKPWQSIAIDNAPLGVASGAASGAFTIGVTTGPIPTEALLEAGADIVYNSMEELSQRINHILI